MAQKSMTNRLTWITLAQHDGAPQRRGHESRLVRQRSWVQTPNRLKTTFIRFSIPPVSHSPFKKKSTLCLLIDHKTSKRMGLKTERYLARRQTTERQFLSNYRLCIFPHHPPKISRSCPTVSTIEMVAETHKIVPEESQVPREMGAQIYVLKLRIPNLGLPSISRETSLYASDPHWPVC